MEWEPSRRRYELKIILAALTQPTDLPPDPLRSDEAVSIEGLYLPLVSE